MIDCFGQRLKNTRETRGLSQSELAEKLGYKSHVMISQAERDKSVLDNNVLAKIADILDVDLNWLITGKYSKTQEKLAYTLLKQTSSKLQYLLEKKLQLSENINYHNIKDTKKVFSKNFQKEIIEKDIEDVERDFAFANEIIKSLQEK
jgi:transcriptional regulator with XRE-family HTH domain